MPKDFATFLKYNNRPIPTNLKEVREQFGSYVDFLAFVSGVEEEYLKGEVEFANKQLQEMLIEIPEHLLDDERTQVNATLKFLTEASVEELNPHYLEAKQALIKALQKDGFVIDSDGVILQTSLSASGNLPGSKK